MAAPGLTRRALLRLGARATLVAGAVAAGCRPGGSDDRQRVALLALATKLGGAGEVGRRYLERHPADADESALAEALLEGLALDSAPSGEALAERLRERNRRDLETGDVVRLEGWILGRTEARLYALASLAALP